MVTDLIRRANLLATVVSEVLGKHPEPSSITDGEKAGMRKLAEVFAIELNEAIAADEPRDAWQISKGTAIANAVMRWAIYDVDYEKIKQASREYEESRQ
jgi:hypothetical protein